MVWDFIDILQDDTLSCDQKLDEIQNLIQGIGHPPPGSLDCVSDIFEDCVNQEHTKCLRTAYLITEEVNGLRYTGIGRGLEAIGEADINVVNQFIKQQIQSQDPETAYNLSTLIPRLYKGQEGEMAGQLPDWYNTYSDFFFRALETTLIDFLEDSSGHGAEDYSNELDPIKDKLEDIAQTHDLDPDNAYQDKNYKVVKVSILLDDLKWNTQKTVNWNEVQSNLSQYPHLEALLTYNNSPISNLKQHNTHPLTKLLMLDNSNKLSYYNHCLELIQPGRGQNSDPNARIRDKLLARKSFDSTIAEIEVFNALRREFDVNDVAIEQRAPNGGVPDAKITTEGETIWVEITLPQPQPSYQVGRLFGFSNHPEESEVRSYVTKKLDKQVIDVKEATDDLTMLVIKNEYSRLDEDTFRNYVEGELRLAYQKDNPDADPVLVRGEQTGLEYDDVTDHLDVIILFDTLTDLSSSPYIEGQVANLTDVNQAISDQLVNAFNAEELAPR